MARLWKHGLAKKQEKKAITEKKYNGLVNPSKRRRYIQYHKLHTHFDWILQPNENYVISWRYIYDFDDDWE